MKKILNVGAVTLLVGALLLSFSATIFAVDTNDVSRYKVSGFPNGVDTTIAYSSQEQYGDTGLVVSPLQTLYVNVFGHEMTTPNDFYPYGVSCSAPWYVNAYRWDDDLIVQYHLDSSKFVLDHTPSSAEYPYALEIIIYCSNLPVSNFHLTVNSIEYDFSLTRVTLSNRSNYNKLLPEDYDDMSLMAQAGSGYVQGWSPSGLLCDYDTSSQPVSVYGFRFYAPCLTWSTSTTITLQWDEVFPKTMIIPNMPSQVGNATTLVHTITETLSTYFVPIFAVMTFMMYGLCVRILWHHG